MNIFLFQIDSFATWKWDTKISYMDAGGLHKLPQSSAAPSRSSVTPLRHLPSSHEGGSSLDPSTTGVTVTAWADARGPEEGGDLRSCVVLLPAECAEGGLWTMPSVWSICWWIGSSFLQRPPLSCSLAFETFIVNAWMVILRSHQQELSALFGSGIKKPKTLHENFIDEEYAI